MSRCPPSFFMRSDQILGTRPFRHEEDLRGSLLGKGPERVEDLRRTYRTDHRVKRYTFRTLQSDSGVRGRKTKTEKTEGEDKSSWER